MDEYVEGNLNDSSVVKFQEHLSHCEKCAKAIAGLQQDELFEDLKLARRQNAASPRFSLDSEIVDPGFLASLQGCGYEILGEVTRGGQGIVYKAKQLQTNRIVAIKQLLGRGVESADSIARFKREIELMASLNHPNIVTIFDGGKASNSRFYVMEFVDGEPLGDFWNHEIEPSSGQVAIPRTTIRIALEMVKKICAAVQHLHQNGIIHRDLKPENVLVNSQREPKVLDLGLAKHVEEKPDRRRTKNGEFLGTLAYASPEQTMLDSNLVDTRSDVYSLGVILFELTTGKLPFEVNDGLFDVVNRICNDDSPRPSQINSSIDPDVETIILKSLAKDPDRRYQSVEQLGRDIELYLSSRPIEALRDSKLYVVKKTLLRHKTVASLTGLLFVAGIFFLGVSWFLWSDAVEQRDVARTAQHNESEARQEAETQSYIGNLVATRSLVLANEVAEAKRRLANTTLERRGWEYDYWLARTDTSLATYNVHDLFVRSFCLFDEGRRVASVAGDNSLKVWTFSNSEEQLEVKLDGTPSICLAAGDSSIVGCVVENDRVVFFDANNLNQLREFELKFYVRAAQFLRDGRVLLAGWDDSAESWIAVLDANFDQITYRNCEAIHPSAIAIHPHENVAIVAGRSTAKLDLENLEFAPMLVSDEVTAATFDSDGKQLALAIGNEVALVELESGKEIRRFKGHTKKVSDVAFSPSNKSIVASSVDGTIRSWNSKTGVLETVLLGHDQTATGIQFDNGSGQLLSSSEDGSFKLWEIDGTANPQRFRFHNRVVRDIRFSSDSKQIVSVSEDSTCIVREIETGEVVKHVESGSSLFGACYSPDGTTLALCGDDKLVRLVSLRDGSVRKLSGHSDRVHSVQFSSDGKQLVSSSRDQNVIVWEVATGKVLHELTGHPSCVHAAIFDASGKQIVSRCHTQLRIWDAETGEHLDSSELRIGAEDYSLVLHPGSSYVAAGTSIPGFGRGFVSLVDVKTFEQIGSLEQHNAPITSVDFSPCGTRAVSSSHRSIKIWDLETMKEVTTLDGIESEISCVRFSPDGEMVAAGFQDGTVMIWKSKPRH